MNTCARVICLLADGARADVMAELLSLGRLPHIARYVVDPGWCGTAVSVFPSTTGPAYLPFLTGMTPGSCNVPGIRWFDKTHYRDGDGWLSAHRSYVGFESFLMGRDILPPIQTVFELVPRSYSIFNPIARGAERRNLTRIARIWYWYYGHLTDRWNFVDEAALSKVLTALAHGAEFLFAVFPGIDEYSHLAHPHHASVFERYEWFDSAVGEIVAWLQARGEWEATQLWIVSDHGLSKTDYHFCLNQFLEEHDLPPFFYPLILKRREKRSANMVSGNGMSHLYFRHREGWGGPTPREELEQLSPGLLNDLVSKDAVDIVAVRNRQGGIDVLSKRGEARVSGGAHLCYEVAGSDPFGYGRLPVNLAPHDALAETVESDYPDALFQLVKLFNSPRTGDLTVSATPGHDLRLKYEHPEHRGSHGSLHRSHMRVPLLCNQKMVDRPARTIDLFPTALLSLGLPLPATLEGRSLLQS